MISLGEPTLSPAIGQYGIITLLNQNNEKPNVVFPTKLLHKAELEVFHCSK